MCNANQYRLLAGLGILCLGCIYNNYEMGVEFRMLNSDTGAALTWVQTLGLLFLGGANGVARALFKSNTSSSK